MSSFNEISRNRILLGSRSLLSITYSVMSIDPQLETQIEEEKWETDYKLAKSLILNIKYGLSSSWENWDKKNSESNKPKIDDCELK